MRLKKIELQGFKSFADRTKLEFNHGITAIVGPNGCGKSNIADAFRWVLGEQSAKSMRSHKMNDLIFAGTSNRKPLEHAEVTITFTDVAGALPIDDNNVSVTRRLYQNGESEYLINHQNCRLKDVQNLLLDSGLGKNAFSTFEQGKLDQVIHLPPKERRVIFEDTAGITRFLMRKKESLLKLEQTEQNIALIKASFREVETQVVTLQQQAKKALDFQAKSNLLEHLEKSILISKYDGANKKSQEIQRFIHAQAESFSEADEDLKTWQNCWQQAKSSVEQAEFLLRKTNEDLYSARSVKEMTNKELMNFKERLRETIEKEKKLLQEKSDLLEKQKELQNQIVEKDTKQKALEKHLNSVSSLLHQQREKLEKTENEVSRFREKQRKSQQEKASLLQIQNQIENQLSQAKVRIENSQERIKQLQYRYDEVLKSIKELEKMVEEKNKSVLEQSQNIGQQKKSLHLVSTQIQETSSKISEQQQEIGKISKEITEYKARQKVLKRLREELQGFSQGTKQLLKEAKTPSSTLYQKIHALYELFSIEAKCDPLVITAAMRPYRQTVVVQTVQELQKVLDLTRKEKIKDISVLCLENISRDNCLSISKIADESARTLIPENEQPLVKHFLNNILVVPSTEQAIEIQKTARKEIWTEEGSYVDRYGVVFFPTQGETDPFVRENELKTLEQEIEEKENLQSQKEKLLSELQKINLQLQNQKENILKDIRQEEIKGVEYNFSLKRAEMDLEKTKKEKLQFEAESRSLNEITEKLSDLIQDGERNCEEAKAKYHDAQSSLAALDAEIEQKSISFKIEQKGFREQEGEYQKNQEQNQKLVYSVNLLQMQNQECQNQQKRNFDELKSCQESQEKLNLLVNERTLSLQEIEKSLENKQNVNRHAEMGLKNEKTNLETLELQSEKIHAKIKQQQQQHFSLQNQLIQQNTIQKNAETELLERFQLSIEEALNLTLTIEANFEPMEKQTRTLRKEIESLGAVNMTAIEECSEQEKRVQFLSEQIADLSSSKQELIQIITNLDNECRKIFKSTFEIVRMNFRKNFQILFNGGEADLQFTDSDNVLEAGVEIIAKPPGKQMRSISLLSGGEKCMTALALLFAIFEYKPAPFCILDEIDAPLDDSNIERFSNVLQQFTDKCQFLIITHNKRTMSIADILFGVSMEVRGISTILSLSFQGAESLVEVV